MRNSLVSGRGPEVAELECRESSEWSWESARLLESITSDLGTVRYQLL